MILKIYLVVSIITLIAMTLTTFSATNKIKNAIKNGEVDIEKKKYTKNKAGLVLAFVKMAIVSFIPVLNIIILFIIMFRSEELEKSIMKNTGIKLNE